MDFHDRTPGNHVRLDGGIVAEVVAPTEDGRWIKVRYVESPDHPALVGTEDLCSGGEIEVSVSEVD